MVGCRAARGFLQPGEVAVALNHTSLTAAVQELLELAVALNHTSLAAAVQELLEVVALKQTSLAAALQASLHCPR